ncbi:MAG: tetratricopeptide repeat protein [Pyrinomonadaceae bacterium]
MITVFISLISSTRAQTLEADKEKLKTVNAEVIKKFQSRDYDDALKSAKTALALSSSIFGMESDETATAYSNLGEVYSVTLKYRDAAENLQQALIIYQKNLMRNGPKIVKVLDSLAIALTLDQRKEEAEPIFTQAVANAEKVFGKETKETLPSLKSLTDFYIYTKQHDLADEVFLKRYLIRHILIQKKDASETDEIWDDRFCYMSQHFSREENIRRTKAFDEKVSTQRIARFGDTLTSKPGATINGGVINGKAISLPKPKYPAQARSARVSGTVSVKSSD